jgi:diguanylate cyclase (GGDEF)-like protein/PAS domain S-box-containing protein
MFWAGIVVIVVAGTIIVALIAGRGNRGNRGDRAMRDANLFASAIIENAGEGIVVYDRDLRYVVWNRSMEELTGLSAESVLGRTATDVFPHLREQGVDEMIQRAMRGESVSSPDIHYYVPGSSRSGWVSGVYRPHYDASGNIAGVIGLVRDITERKTAEQQIEYQAYHDALTGLANRRLFQEHLTLALALAGRRRRLVAVLFLDLDHFKLVNDTLGHTLGDALLREVGVRLKRAVREGDTVARVGGDEFTIVLQDLEKKEDAASVAQKVIRAVSEPVIIDGHRLYVTTSVGVTVFPDDGEDAETLLKNADNAVYRAKAQGRNTYQMSTAELNQAMHDRLAIESGLHQAMERSEFEIYYQPQIDVRSMRVIGMEALLRWNHPSRGVLAPASFMTAAEERGFIVLIGDWVLRTACRQAMEFHSFGNDFRVAVNLSARQFHDDSLVESVRLALRDSGLDPHCLELEITESIAMQDLELTLSVLAALHDSGVSIAIDDFGTGHSSLSYLKRFPIDALKIDKSFVEDLPDGFEDAAIVRSVIQLAEGLNLRVVAEGVETKEQLDFLVQHNCTEVQGYYFAYPEPAERRGEMLKKQVAK